MSDDNNGKTKAEPGQEKKPGTITIKVSEQGQETLFKIKRTTKMSKVFEAFAQRKGVEAKNLRFLLDGERILDESTPEDNGLEDDDQIDCMLHSVGGGCLA